MTIPKVFVNSNMTATFACESCGELHTKDVSKFVGHKTRVRLKYKCKCGHTFSVFLERRRGVRKEVFFKGLLIQNQKAYRGVITDMSLNGIRFKTTDKARIEEDTVAEVKFTLDNRSRSEVLRPIKIRKVFSENCLGCEFVDTNHFDDLGKYFLFHFDQKK
ncbi:PilZ domain-containing protein [Desulfobacter latus]|uniref:PilZ domain-containing protein n=1 Tax=Desulfobacter latus TaxID=2292 RepID=A0A850SYF9_9BACT|nr:PilZ domain-containing protein [Desulfobacter latus]NWH06344.1 PilZ domain-containing protein [Desulfobacter latus]